MVTTEQRILAYAERLSGFSAAVDTLIVSLNKVLDQPNDQRYRNIDMSNRIFQSNVASAPGAIDFLKAVGYVERHRGHLLLSGNIDLERVQTGRSALESIRSSAAYEHSREARQLKHALNVSSSEYEAEVSRRRATFAQRVPDEPVEGAMGSSLICFHVSDGNANEQKVWRRFESCNTLEDLLNFARSLDDAPLSNIQLSNVTMSPEIPLDEQTMLGMTLQRLELWPTGHIRVGRT